MIENGSCFMVRLVQWVIEKVAKREVSCTWDIFYVVPLDEDIVQDQF